MLGRKTDLQDVQIDSEESAEVFQLRWYNPIFTVQLHKNYTGTW